MLHVTLGKPIPEDHHQELSTGSASQPIPDRESERRNQGAILRAGEALKCCSGTIAWQTSIECDQPLM